jgi:uncharacterized protein YybS (DUF2232 family)
VGLPTLVANIACLVFLLLQFLSKTIPTRHRYISIFSPARETKINPILLLFDLILLVPGLLATTIYYYNFYMLIILSIKH